MKQRSITLCAAAVFILSLTACNTSSTSSQNQNDNSSPASEQLLVLSDSAVTLNGEPIGDSAGAVTIGNNIVYYEADKGTEYGEGTQEDEHSAEEAASHTVVTIQKPGTYRVSGTLSAGQLAIDLGEEAKENPEAVVTLILDNVNIACSVAPAVIFYNVYECDTDWVAYDAEETERYDSSTIVDTTAAGANVILADDSENHISGAYVARIYKEGTTKKLHKYDGAFYSKMSMNLSAEEKGTGILKIDATNEGLDSELHLTINGGMIQICAANDGINTNEDNVSVTTINGGTLQINAGSGVEGDGIDSNGHLVINGGTVYTMSNDRSPDGGIDADGDILINGGFVLAQGTRNDAVSNQSEQKFMELSFASTLPLGSVLELTDSDNNILFAFTTEKACQSITFSSPELKYNVAYQLTVNGIVQQYTGTASGGFGPMGGNPFNGQFPGEMPRPDEGDFPGNMNQHKPPEIPNPDSSWTGEPPERPEFMEGMENRPFGGKHQRPELGQDVNGSVEPSEQFILSEQVHSFSGISDSTQASGKTAVTFSAEVITVDGSLQISSISADMEIDPSKVQLTVVDEPSEDYSASCLWADGEESIQALLPDEPGFYRLTIAITGSEEYTGSTQIPLVIPEKSE